MPTSPDLLKAAITIILLSDAGLNEIFATSRQTDRNPPRSDGFVTRWKIPELIDQGIGQFFELRQGLGLLINNWRSRHNLFNFALSAIIVIKEQPYYD